MSNRIRELRRQATLVETYTSHDGSIHEGKSVDLEKFAELMVKKFDDILLLQQLDCIGNHDKKSGELIEKIRDKTKTYFGVEE